MNGTDAAKGPSAGRTRQNASGEPRCVRGRPRRQLPVESLVRCRCPFCGSVDCPTVRTLASDADLLHQERACRTCGETFEAISD